MLKTFHTSYIGKKEIAGSHSSGPAFSDAVSDRMQHGRSTVCKLGLISQRNIRKCRILPNRRFFR